MLLSLIFRSVVYVMTTTIDNADNAHWYGLSAGGQC